MNPNEPPFINLPNETPSAHPSPLKKGNLWIVLLSSLVGIGIIGTTAYWGYGRYKDRKLYRPESGAQREHKVKEAFSGARADLTTTEARSVDRFFKEQGDAQNRKDIQWQLQHYDFLAMFEAVQEQADFPEAEKVISYLKSNDTVIQSAMKRQFALFLKELTYSSHRLQRLEFNQDKSLALAYVLATDADGLHSRSRVWLKRADATWLIYDEEDLEMGLRNSLLIGNMLGSKPLPKMNQAVLSFASLIQRMQTGDSEESQKMITKLKSSPLPSQLKGVVYFLDASLLLEEQKYEDALKSVAEVRHLVPDSVGVERLAAAIYSAMDKHDEALAAARKFMDFLGLDPESVVVASKALKEQKKPEEAWEILAHALKEFPDDIGLLAQLPKLATGEQMKGSLTRALGAAQDSESLFETLAEEYSLWDEFDALVVLTSAMREHHPKSESLEEYQTKADDYLLLKRAKADLHEATPDLKAKFMGDDAVDNLDRLTRNLNLPVDEATYAAICRIFAENQPNATKELAKAKAGLTLGLCYAEMEKHDDAEVAFFEHKLSDGSQRVSYVRTLADAACLDSDTSLLSDLLDALKKVEPNSPLLVEYQAKLKQLESDDLDSINNLEK